MEVGAGCRSGGLAALLVQVLCHAAYSTALPRRGTILAVKLRVILEVRPGARQWN